MQQCSIILRWVGREGKGGKGKSEEGDDTN